MLKAIKKFIKKSINLMGYNIINLKYINNNIIPNYDPIIESDKRFKKIYERCFNYTITSKERMYALYKSVEYIIKTDVPGDFVECGVWKGGSLMLIAYTLLELNTTNKKIYLYDTFQGMTEPIDEDYYITNKNIFAKKYWEQSQKKDYNEWCYASIDEVKNNMLYTKYPENNIVYVKGKVEETIPKIIPSKISLLRLDTDWYDSTMHELIQLYPFLSKNSVIIIDDYGHWAGAKKTVDEYFKNKKILLNRIDYTGRIAIKIDN